jgi:uridine kinase
VGRRRGLGEYRRLDDAPHRVNGLREVAARIEPGMRVGIDGVSAAGKTTFADALVASVDAPVVRASLDDFHFPRAIRYARGEGADSYYEATFDAVRFRRELLEPFARREPIRTRIFDHVDDRPIDDPPFDAPPGAVLVVDGIWLHKPELRDAFDLTVWLQIDRQVALERAIARDAARMTSVEAARERYATRYFPGETRYLEEIDPASLADIVVDTA